MGNSVLTRGFVALCNERRAEVEWKIPDDLWNQIMANAEDLFSEKTMGNEEEINKIVDSLIMNSDYCEIEHLPESDLKNYMDFEDDDENEEHGTLNLERLKKDFLFVYKDPDSKYGYGVCRFLA